VGISGLLHPEPVSCEDKWVLSRSLCLVAFDFHFAREASCKQTDKVFGCVIWPRSKSKHQQRKQGSLFLFPITQNKTFSNLLPALLLGKVTVLVTSGWRNVKKCGVRRKAPSEMRPLNDTFAVPCVWLGLSPHEVSLF